MIKEKYFLFLNRKITIKESALKEIFKAGDFENVSITFVGVTWK